MHAFVVEGFRSGLPLGLFVSGPGVQESRAWGLGFGGFGLGFFVDSACWFFLFKGFRRACVMSFTVRRSVLRVFCMFLLLSRFRVPVWNSLHEYVCKVTSMCSSSWQLTSDFLRWNRYEQNEATL